MENFDRKNHWETIYQNKALENLSWFEPNAQAALKQFDDLKISKQAQIIDIGGGDSLLVDHLLNLGFENITVLDISEEAIKRAQKRLGHLAQKVTWIVSDILQFKPTEKYDYWYDRAAFHFLTTQEEIHQYVKIMSDSTRTNALASIGTFSLNGPQKCSGIAIKQYDEKELAQTFDTYFEKLFCKEINHCTPSLAIQQFIFCSFIKR
jgi:cyclopropane fatty-acyl-phospholipid synthase-like methyltransferase